MFRPAQSAFGMVASPALMSYVRVGLDGRGRRYAVRGMPTATALLAMLTAVGADYGEPGIGSRGRL